MGVERGDSSVVVCHQLFDGIAQKAPRHAVSARRIQHERGDGHKDAPSHPETQACRNPENADRKAGERENGHGNEEKAWIGGAEPSHKYVLPVRERFHEAANQTDLVPTTRNCFPIDHHNHGSRT